MIADPETLHAYSGVQLIEQIMDQLDLVCGHGLDLDDGRIEEVGRAVEEALGTYGVEACVDSVMLVSLVSRALSAIGEETAARRLFLLGSGALRPSEWAITGDRTMWVLDLRQLAAPGDALLEMRLLSALNIVLETISDIWDEADGQGYLGLVNLPERCRSRVRNHLHRDETVLSDEIVEQCALKLQHIGQRKGWCEAPAVLNLDLKR